jgi:hypothetical protein
MRMTIKTLEEEIARRKALSRESFRQREQKLHLDFIQRERSKVAPDSTLESVTTEDGFVEIRVGDTRAVTALTEAIRSVVDEITRGEVEAAEFMAMLKTRKHPNIDEFMLPTSRFTLPMVANLSGSEKAAKWVASEISKQAKIAADKRHEEDRKKREAIRAILAQGNYKTKKLCAEKECKKIGMSKHTAEKALNGIPNPGRAKVGTKIKK